MLRRNFFGGGCFGILRIIAGVIGFVVLLLLGREGDGAQGDYEVDYCREQEQRRADENAPTHAAADRVGKGGLRHKGVEAVETHGACRHHQACEQIGDEKPLAVEFFEIQQQEYKADGQRERTERHKEQRQQQPQRRRAYNCRAGGADKPAEVEIHYNFDYCYRVEREILLKVGNRHSKRAKREQEREKRQHAHGDAGDTQLCADK